MLHKTKTLTTSSRQKKAKEKALTWTSQTGKEPYKNHSEKNRAYKMLKRTTKPLRRRVLTEEGLARSSDKQRLENTDKWHLCKAGSFSYGKSPRTPPLEGTSLHRRNISVERPWGFLSLFTTCLRLWVKSHCHLLPHLQNMPQKAVEKKEESYKMLRRSSLVLGFLHSVNHTGSPQDKSYSHSYFTPGQNNKSYKKLKQAAHNSWHNTINSKHNQHQHLHFTYLQLRKVWTGMLSFADHFSTKLKWSGHKHMSNSLLWHTTTCLGANTYIPQALSYIGQLVMTSYYYYY